MSFAQRLCTLLLVVPSIHATPLSDTHKQHTRRSNGDSGAIQVWVPIIAVALVVLVGIIMIWRKHSLRSGFSQWGAAAAFGSGLTLHSATTPGPLEVTADQLAGVPPNTAASPTVASAGRRARRNRRTPSQISTRSLPAYNKEPGDEELVIFRGPTDMEDVQTTIVMPSVDEQDVDSMHSRNTSHASSTYPPEPHSTNTIALLHNEPHSASTNSDSNPSGGDPPVRESFERSEDTPDPRGEAPPYFEVIEHQNDSLNTTTDTPVQSPPTSERATRRRSGFRSILHALDRRSRTPIPAASQLHATNPAPGHTPRHTPSPRPSAYHRPSQSGSGLGLSPFRTISRQRSTHTMASSAQHPASSSTISLNSISAPLTHTAVRTEFTYPKAGPTPEQLKLISSRENFARFGMPYGADAIAYAASTSRQELDPPPDFESEAGRGAVVSEVRSDSAISLPIPETSNSTGVADGSSRGVSPVQAQVAGASSDRHAEPAPDGIPVATTSNLPTVGIFPPSTYKSISIPHLRPASRSSSMMSNASYATAAESMAGPGASSLELDLGSPATLHHVETDTLTTPLAPRGTDKPTEPDATTGLAVLL